MNRVLALAYRPLGFEQRRPAEGWLTLNAQRVDAVIRRAAKRDTGWAV
jgi:hypothetical protein